MTDLLNWIAEDAKCIAEKMNRTTAELWCGCHVPIVSAMWATSTHRLDDCVVEECFRCGATWDHWEARMFNIQLQVEALSSKDTYTGIEYKP